jgi:hypothetical protein
VTWDIGCADLVRDRQMMIDAVVKYLNPRADDKRFDWLYFKNPHGSGRAWIARDKESQSFLGMASAFPRRVYRQDREEVGWVLGEFCIHEQHRTLGPALKLQRAILDELKSDKIALFYDFPSRSMMAIYSRLSIETSHKMLRLACPIRLDQKLSDLLTSPWLASVVSPIANAALRMRNRPGKLPRHLAISLFAGPCESEFSELTEEIRGHWGNIVQRSAEYLNWRYFQNPQQHCEMLVARSHGRVIAYAVFTQDGGHGLLLDLFGYDDPAVFVELIKHTATIFAQREVSTFSVFILDSHPIVPVLQGLGFSERENSPALIYEVERCSAQSSQYPDRWCLMHGDRDS